MKKSVKVTRKFIHWGSLFFRYTKERFFLLRATRRGLASNRKKIIRSIKMFFFFPLDGVGKKSKKSYSQKDGEGSPLT